MIKVLNVLTGAHTGGISTTVLNFYKAINAYGVHYDLAITKDAVGINGKVFLEMGSKIYRLPKKSKHPFKYCKELKKILIEGGYDAIHVHENLTSFVALRTAKKAGIKKRVAHAHTASRYKGIINKIRQLSGHLFNSRYATDLVACSSEAGICIFGKKCNITVINNGIFLDKYSFSLEKRKKLRKENGIDINSFVIGTVGRLSKEKNHIFLIDIFKKYNQNVKPNSKLLIIGSGNEQDNILNYIKENDLGSSVLLLGTRSDVADLLNVFDVFLLPSLFEGFPVVAGEALANGLHVGMSNVITKDLQSFESIKYLSLDSVDGWVDFLVEISSRFEDRKRIESLVGSNVDIFSNAQKLLEIYSN